MSLSLVSTLQATQDVPGLVPGELYFFFRYRSLTTAGRGAFRQAGSLRVG